MYDKITDYGYQPIRLYLKMANLSLNDGYRFYDGYQSFKWVEQKPEQEEEMEEISDDWEWE